MKIRTVAVITSLDTKSIEVAYLAGLLLDFGVQPFIIDVGAKKTQDITADIDALEIAHSSGHMWESPFDVSKSEMISVLRDGLEILLPELYRNETIDGVISFGGLQNTVMSTQAMFALPIGVPKVVVSTVACGNRTFESVIGSSDILVMSSITDFTGRNMITDTILRNAAAAVAGMVLQTERKELISEKRVIGVTLMGVVTKGASAAIELLKEYGYEVLSFHSTGVGGQILDDLIEQRVIDGVLEFSAHELVGELFGGYSRGTKNRIGVAAKAGIPQVVTLGALDFLDFNPSSDKFTVEGRKYIYHNEELVHAKVLRSEAEMIGKEVASRINKSKGPVVLLVPLKGFRQNTLPGEPLFNPEIDGIIIEEIEKNLRSDIPVIRVDENINDAAFSLLAAQQIYKLIQNKLEPGEKHE